MKWPVLKPGDSGEAVRLIQIQLNAIAAVYTNYYAVGSSGGNFGPATQRAVNRLQQLGSINESGQVGPKTRSKILELLNKMAKEKGKVYKKNYNRRTWLISGKNRPGVKMTPKFITVHQTGNPNPGANAAAHRNYAQNNDRQVSYQWVVDDKEAILCIPENEVAWHAGREANYNSIAVEICENSDANQNNIYANAIHHIATMAVNNGFELDQVRTHQSWTGKVCPHKLIGVFHQVLADIGATIADIKGISEPEPKPPAPAPGPPVEPEPPAEPEPPTEPEPPVDPEPLPNWLTRIISAIVDFFRNLFNRDDELTQTDVAWLNSESVLEDLERLDDEELVESRELLAERIREVQREIKPQVSKWLDDVDKR